MSSIKITCSEDDKKQLLYLFVCTDTCPFDSLKEMCKLTNYNCFECIEKNIEFEIKESELDNTTKLNSLWCSRNNCTHYNKEANKCTRIGKYSDNKDKIGICCLNINEGDY